VLTVADHRRTHADWHQAVVEPDGWRWLERPLYEVLLSHDRTISVLRANMGEARLAEVLAIGRKLDLEKSIAHALLTMHWSDEGMRQDSRRRCMVAPLSQRTRLLVAGLRSPCEADISRLAELMYGAYRGTTDDRGESIDDAAAEVRRTFAGEYGAFEPGCSKVIEVGAQILSATLITRWQAGPFVAFSMTAPGFKRTGLARTCLLDAMQDLFERGEREIRLMVTWSNLPARNLYGQLGFRVQE
jgi:GNAT superfamily N-acetyltransferase